MSRCHDWVDWLGGYKYEFAGPEEVVRSYQPHGLTLENQALARHNGCNPYVFRLDHPEMNREPGCGLLPSLRRPLGSWPEPDPCLTCRASRGHGTPCHPDSKRRPSTAAAPTGSGRWTFAWAPCP